MEDTELHQSKNSRRSILRNIVGAGAIAGATSSGWVKPVINAATLPAHAETSEIVTTESVTPQPPLSCGNVEITQILYRQNPNNTTADEYVELTNNDSSAVDLNGWMLRDRLNNQPNFWVTFSESVVLQPGDSCRVYTYTAPGDQCAGASGMQPPWNMTPGNYVWNNPGDIADIFCPDGVPAGSADMGVPKDTCSYDDNPDTSPHDC